MPGLVSAYKDIMSNNVKEIPVDFAFKLYDTYGLDEETILKLANALNLPYKQEGLKKALEQLKICSKTITNSEKDDLAKRLDAKNIKPTPDAHKYKYVKKNGAYAFNNLPIQVNFAIKS